MDIILAIQAKIKDFLPVNANIAAEILRQIKELAKDYPDLLTGTIEENLLKLGEEIGIAQTTEVLEFT